MKMDGIGESDNVEDARGSSGGGGGMIGGRSIGIGTIVIALLGGWIFGVNPLTILSLLSGGSPAQVQQAPDQSRAPVQSSPAEDKEVKFVKQVLLTTEEAWTDVFAKAGGTYQPPRLHLFRGSEQTACGSGVSAMGPFYCPGDRKVYIDLGFYDTLKTRLGAPGEFAQAYVVAHEVGHHVQNLLGISSKVEQAQSRASKVEANALSVRLELQADCFAGVWANRAQISHKFLEQGDVESAMNAAARIGDDALQRSAGGAVVPESFTHGSSAQRQRWFDAGLKGGSIQSCDTFGSRNL